MRLGLRCVLVLTRELTMDLMTVGELVRALEAPAYRIRYQIDTHAIEPARRVGASLLYGPSEVEQIRELLDRSAARRKGTLLTS